MEVKLGLLKLREGSSYEGIASPKRVCEAYDEDDIRAGLQAGDGCLVGGFVGDWFAIDFEDDGAFS